MLSARCTPAPRSVVPVLNVSPLVTQPSSAGPFARSFAGSLCVADCVNVSFFTRFLLFPPLEKKGFVPRKDKRARQDFWRYDIDSFQYFELRVLFCPFCFACSWSFVNATYRFFCGQLEMCDGGYRATREFKLRSPAVAFHGVTEE